jgi:hypothetical protein
MTLKKVTVLVPDVTALLPVALSSAQNTIKITQTAPNAGGHHE